MFYELAKPSSPTQPIKQKNQNQNPNKKPKSTQKNNPTKSTNRH